MYIQSCNTCTSSPTQDGSGKQGIVYVRSNDNEAGYSANPEWLEYNMQGEASSGAERGWTSTQGQSLFKTLRGAC